MADMLSQEEIDLLLKGGAVAEPSEKLTLSDQEKDALGEIGNISMGTAATTLFTLLSKRVTITTPRVTETTLNDMIENFQEPYVIINVSYTEGITGSNILILNEQDVKIITDLMMGGDGTNLADELGELHLSAISEAMNQMIGSSSTALSEMLGHKIDISPPEASYQKLESISSDDLGFASDDTVVMIAFDMKISDLIDSEIMQVMSVEVAKRLVSSLMPGEQAPPAAEPVAEAASAAPAQAATESQPAVPPVQPAAQPAVTAQPAVQPTQSVQPTAQPRAPQPSVNAQTVQFERLDGGAAPSSIGGDIDLIREVPLEISVELGRTAKKISEILAFSNGTVVELNKLVGEPLDVMANGKLIARGEVVVVDDNYGVRITEIVVPERRWVENN